jgi:hypothetical protein
LTLTSVVWQRISGPTHPVRVNERVDGATITGKLLRAHVTSSPLPVTITCEPAPAAITGTLHWRRYPTDEMWNTLPMSERDGQFSAAIPVQPAAGKVEYRVQLEGESTQLFIPAGPAIVARFRDEVPGVALVPHIILIFCAMLWSSRAGLEALAKGPRLKQLSLLTLLLLVAGGLILGPIVQKYAFGAFWTGWPLGEDLTDNKIAIAALAWVNALIQLRVGRGGRWSVLVAAVVTLVVFAIPHSMHGSTLDYETMQQISH